MKEESNMRPAFAGKAVPQLIIEATSLHTNPADVRVASKTFWAYESNVDYIPGGSKEKFINMDFAWIKHFLDVVVFKGREMTDEEAEMLELGYVDYDDNGQYEPVETEDVIKAWGILFDNVVKLVETGGEMVNLHCLTRQVNLDNSGLDLIVIIRTKVIGLSPVKVQKKAIWYSQIL